MPDTNLRQLTPQQFADPALTTQIRDLVTVINELVTQLGSSASSVPSDLNPKMLLPLLLTKNNYSLAVEAKDGSLHALPGIFRKSDKLLDPATIGQIAVADTDGNYRPASIVAGAGITVSIDGEAGTVTIINDDPLAGANFRIGSEALTANVTKAITFTTEMSSGTVRVGKISCVDGTGADVPVSITLETTTGFSALSLVDATLIYIGVLDQ